MIYQINIADGRELSYETDSTLDELKNEIMKSDFISIYQYGRHVDFKTSCITSIFRDVEREESLVRREKSIKDTKPYIDEINSFEPNNRMKLWLFWFHIIDYDDKYLRPCGVVVLKEIIAKFKKYKCKRKTTQQESEVK